MKLSCSRAYPVIVDTAFDRVLPMPLPTLFRRWFGFIPPIRSTDEDSIWGTRGQQRTVILVGPGHMMEVLTEVDPPNRFTYRLTEISGPLAMIASEVEGSWRFDPAGTGTRITWSWNVRLRLIGKLIAPLFKWCWQGYARAALTELETHLLADSDSAPTAVHTAPSIA